MLRVNWVTAMLLGALVAPSSHAQSPYQSRQEQEFLRMFRISGYSTLFGAALGASLLPFLHSPSQKAARFIMGGASLGFIGGSFIGLYGILSSSHPAAYEQMSYVPQEGQRYSASVKRASVDSSNTTATAPVLFKRVSVPVYVSANNRVEITKGSAQNHRAWSIGWSLFF